MIASYFSVTGTPLSDKELQRIDAWWRAANYLSIGQIYLLDNPLLKQPLALEHIKPRLLGHWGTTPGLNMIYTHLNRVIKARDLNMIYVTGPGHGAPGIVANTWLEGSYTDLYPNITRDDSIPTSPGMKKVCANCFASSLSPAEFPATPHRKHPAPSMKEGNWVIHSATLMAQPSITRT